MNATQVRSVVIVIMIWSITKIMKEIKCFVC